MKKCHRYRNHINSMTTNNKTLINVSIKDRTICNDFADQLKISVADFFTLLLFIYANTDEQTVAERYKELVEMI